MTAMRYSFDVEVRHGSRWIMDCTQPREYPARKRAEALLANPACEGARIIRTWSRPDGVDVDSEIFCQIREIAADTTIRVTQLDAIGVICRTPDDFYGFESRQIMSRIFRDYLERAGVTPTEILHTPRHLDRLAQQEGLLRDAVDMAARLQTRGSAQRFEERRDEIQRAVDTIFTRAREDEGGDRQLAALSRDLGQCRGWLGKLEKLCVMAETERDPQALDRLDGIIADLLATSIIEDIIGVQPSLGAQIRALLNVAAGLLPTIRGDAATTTARLCRLLAQGRLKLSRRCLVARAHRALRQPRPLKPNDPALEQSERDMIVNLLVTPQGLLDGAETAQALTIRFSRSVEQGGVTGFREAIVLAFRAMPDPASSLRYLCDLAASDSAAAHLPQMEALLAAMPQAGAIGEFCGNAPDTETRMACATATYHAIAVSPFSADLKASITEHIDTLLEQLIVGGNVIETLDEPGAHLRDRALRLVRLCDVGSLPRGRALAQARKRVLALLKQPDFVENFLAGLNDTQTAQSALRDFFALLKSTGLHQA